MVYQAGSGRASNTLTSEFFHLILLPFLTALALYLLLIKVLLPLYRRRLGPSPGSVPPAPQRTAAFLTHLRNRAAAVLAAFVLPRLGDGRGEWDLRPGGAMLGRAGGGREDEDEEGEDGDLANMYALEQGEEMADLRDRPR